MEEHSEKTREENGVVKIITIYYTTKLDRLVKSKTVRGTW